ncbi:hypothetical protein CQW23_30868 [Capsicum baccatum]|uniref:Uncharacterized protein n=1 Tax=Capsicum baccatum TaxID=33114 RepID=A0A2G2V974_CAPBA|nr:hypothetical protein CQW23_30868 [Capsicum baccatum]
MNDSSAREMNDRPPQRTCGCVDVFFQLFDRNSRFSKKLFPKKLLSPDKLSARPDGSDKEDIDFKMAKIKSLELGLQRFRAKCPLTYPTRYFSPLEDKSDLVGNSLDHHSTDSYLSSTPNSSSNNSELGFHASMLLINMMLVFFQRKKVLAESVDSVDDESLFPEPDRDLLDCETSLSTMRSCRELVNNVSGVLSKIHQLKGSNLCYAK